MSVPTHAAHGVDRASWLDTAPSHWVETRLRFVVRLNPSKSEASGMDRSEEISFVPMDAVGDNGSLRLDQTRPIGEVETGYTYFRDGDVVVAKITPCFENGKGAIMRGLIGGVGFGTTELIVARPTGKTSAAYIYWLFNSAAFRKHGEGAMYGAGGQKRVPEDFVRDFPVALPSPPEQSSIAAFLDRETGKIDALVEAQRRLIELLKEKRQAVISHAVTKGLDPTAPTRDSGVEWLGEVPAHWDVKRFSKAVIIAEGQIDPRREPYASMVLIAPNHIESWTGRLLAIETAAEQGADSGKYVFNAGDVVYSKIRPSLAKVVIAPCDGLCSADMYPLKGRPGLTQSFLKWALLSPGFTAWAILESDRVAMPKINREKLNELRLPVPPEPEQTMIINYVESQARISDALIAEARAAILLLHERRSALISAAVTGKIDVRGIASAETIAA